MDILFTTFNARYSHTSLSLRCLRANLGALHDSSAIIEFDNRISPHIAAEKLLAEKPRLILFSVYIWNRIIVYETAAIIRRVHPEIKIAIGGPEVCYDNSDSLLIALTDHLLRGEGEPYIETFCRDILNCGADIPVCSGQTGMSAPRRPPKIISGAPADLKKTALPYDEYTDDDIAHRRIYVETSRGCPFGCEYCLSALDQTVRFFPPARIFPAFEKLIARGARIFKFIDRSFNINTAHAAAVLNFFLERQQAGMMLHLEWEPEILPPALEKILSGAPAGFFQLETGVQTFNAEVAERIHRRFNAGKIEQNIRKLAAMNSVHLHADLIAGLPGETFASIAGGFDRLHACGPQEIQLGILKKLHGAPIARHDVKWQMVYNTAPPYDVLQTATLSFVELQEIRRFARFWDITVNNGRFPHAAPLIWKKQPAVFAAFMEWSEWLYKRTGSSMGIAPVKLAGLLEKFLTGRRKLDSSTVRRAIDRDLNNSGASLKGMERQTRKT
ncbi:MAG: DUF4080 domain-containing protein [Kiritimatiellales bacterium]